ncbi:Os04g0366200, partial [Oryza sativa Japonica Group]
MPCPPLPRTRVGSKLFVACFSSSKEKIFVLSLALSSDDISCCSRRPWFFLKYFFRCCFRMSLLCLRIRSTTDKLSTRIPKPAAIPITIPTFRDPYKIFCIC